MWSTQTGAVLTKDPDVARLTGLRDQHPCGDPAKSRRAFHAARGGGCHRLPRVDGKRRLTHAHRHVSGWTLHDRWLPPVRHAGPVADLNSWIRRVRTSVESVMRGFEERFGYPPDDNLVVAASRPGGAVILRELGGRVPSGVVGFFDAVEEISLPDVWNGYFLGPVDRVVGAYADESPRFITVEGDVVEVLTIGSDGGGALYCVCMEEPAPVFRLDQASIRGGVATAPPGFTRQIAPDFSGFLEALARVSSRASKVGSSRPF